MSVESGVRDGWMFILTATAINVPNGWKTFGVVSVRHFYWPNWPILAFSEEVWPREKIVANQTTFWAFFRENLTFPSKNLNFFWKIKFFLVSSIRLVSHFVNLSELIFANYKNDEVLLPSYDSDGPPGQHVSIRVASAGLKTAAAFCGLARPAA